MVAELALSRRYHNLHAGSPAVVPIDCLDCWTVTM